MEYKANDRAKKLVDVRIDSVAYAKLTILGGRNGMSVAAYTRYIIYQWLLREAKDIIIEPQVKQEPKPMPVTQPQITEQPKPIIVEVKQEEVKTVVEKQDSNIKLERPE